MDLHRLASLLTVPNGGFSIDANGIEPTTGYAVSTFPEFERKLGNVGTDDLDQFLRDNSELLRRPGILFGGWRETESGIAFLDVSTVVNDRETAAKLARDHNQIAFFDFESGTSETL
jgi:hypothetical protein